MKKASISVFMSLMLGTILLPLEGAPNQANQPSHKANSSEQDEYDILERNEIDDTDVLAIPFDDSEVEDEEQINLDEKKEVFHLPRSR